MLPSRGLAGKRSGRCLEAKLIPKAFYSPANSMIFDAMRELYRSGTQIDIATLAEELRTRRQLEAVGGLSYLAGIGGAIPTTAQAGFFLGKVRDNWLLRELVKEANEMIEDASTFTGGLQELLEVKSLKMARMLDYARADEDSPEKKAASGLKRSMAKLAGEGWIRAAVFSRGSRTSTMHSAHSMCSRKIGW